VLDLELLIDKGEFDINTINNLMILYSNAVEYYNGISSEKYTYYEARIQNMLIRPEIFNVMSNASRSNNKKSAPVKQGSGPIKEEPE